MTAVVERPTREATQSEADLGFAARVDHLRTWPLERLHAERDAAVEEERRALLRRLAVDRVIDERGATAGRETTRWVMERDHVASRTARAQVEVARALETLPAIAAAAARGELCMDQLEPLVQLATPETDAEWAVRGAKAAPADLNRMARRAKPVSPDEMADRREARELRWWRSSDGAMLNLRGALPDLDGAFVESVLEHLIDAKRPEKGQPWDTRVHRGADALVDLCRLAADPDARAKQKPWRPRVVIHVGSDAQPAVNGITIDHATTQAFIDAGAIVRTVSLDDLLAPASGDRIPAALSDHLKARDSTCRRPGCTRTYGLEAHHLVPRCEGGPTHKHNVALVCSVDHRLLIPQGAFVLEGDAELPDGLTWRRLDEPGEGAGDPRAGPTAA